MKRLTESTLIPLSLVVVIITVVWAAGAIAGKVEQHSKDIESLKSKQDEISLIRTDIAVMKEDVKNIKETLR